MMTETTQHPGLRAARRDGVLTPEQADTVQKYLDQATWQPPKPPKTPVTRVIGQIIGIGIAAALSLALFSGLVALVVAAWRFVAGL